MLWNYGLDYFSFKLCLVNDFVDDGVLFLLCIFKFILIIWLRVIIKDIY
jgi:hypothetical protein